MTNRDLIQTWENAFSVSLADVAKYKKRLRELSTWAKPTVKKSEDKAGLWVEWAAKKAALRGLICEQYPNTIFTTDDRTILRS